MFPIVSTLRRCAASNVFVRPEMLQRQDGRYWLKLSSLSGSVDFSRGSWNPDHDLVPLYVLVGKSSTSQGVAISLGKKEDALAEKLKILETLYTLVLGPEEQVEHEGVVERQVRIALVRGVYRASGPTGELVKAPSTKHIRRFGKSHVQGHA